MNNEIRRIGSSQLEQFLGFFISAGSNITYTLERTYVRKSFHNSDEFFQLALWKFRANLDLVSVDTLKQIFQANMDTITLIYYA